MAAALVVVAEAMEVVTVDTEAAVEAAEAMATRVADTEETATVMATTAMAAATMVVVRTQVWFCFRETCVFCIRSGKSKCVLILVLHRYQYWTGPRYCTKMVVSPSTNK